MTHSAIPERFDPSSWLSRVGPLEPRPSGCWYTGEIIGPRDAWSVIKLRELIRPHYVFGPKVPVDLFLLSAGEAPRRECTKIGGLPFWPKGRRWPTTAGGDPLPFLAQFCFLDSLDIVGPTPEDMLLLFGDKDNPQTIVAEWQTTKCDSSLIDEGDAPVASPAPAMWGTPWRTHHLIVPVEQSDVNQVWLSDGTLAYDIHNICELNGMQISPFPTFPRCWHPLRSHSKALCSLFGVYPKAGEKWPFLNRANPLSDAEAMELTFDMTHIKDEGVGVVAVVIDHAGQTIVTYDPL